MSAESVEVAEAGLIEGFRHMIASRRHHRRRQGIRWAAIIGAASALGALVARAWLC